MVEPQVKWPWIWAYLPSVLLFFVVLAASLDSRQTSLGNHHIYLGEAPFLIDVVVRHAGVIMPFFVLLLQTLVLSYDELAELGVIGDTPDISCLHCLARRWAWTVFVLWILLAVLRLVLFIPLRTVHLWFSDHLFLIECVLAQLQTKLFLLHRAAFVMRMPDNQGKDYSKKVSVVTRARVLLVVTWIMVLALLFEAYFTAKYFHSVIADWTAFFSGTLLFGLAAGWWIQKLIKSGGSLNLNNADSNARLKEPLNA